jgi:uncharacterized paraquat-inducible protein A
LEKKYYTVTSNQTCEKICLKYKIKYEHDVYSHKDVKRCPECQIFMKYEGVYCPCCNVRLRGRPRNGLGSKGYKKKTKPKYI